jgi:hypothetical protein
MSGYAEDSSSHGVNLMGRLQQQMRIIQQRLFMNTVLPETIHAFSVTFSFVGFTHQKSERQGHR